MKLNSYLLSLVIFFTSAIFSYGQTLQQNKADKIVKGSKLIRQDLKTKRIKYIGLRDDYNYSSTNEAEWLQKSLGSTKKHSFKELNKVTDKKGVTHIKYQTYYKNIPVEWSMYTIHSSNGKIHSANGEFFTGKEISNIPQIAEPEAFQKAIRFVNAKKYQWESLNSPRPKGELTILPVDNTYILTYKFDIYAEEPLSRKYVYIDAVNSNIVKTIDRIHVANTLGTAKTLYNGVVSITTDSYNGTYRLRETGRGNGIETYNLNHGISYASATDFTDTDNNWTDTVDYNHAANDVHYATEATYDYYNNYFNRNSYDDKGSVLKSYVHYSRNYANAFWDGSCMTYGDGDGMQYLPLTAIEIIAHEITHGVTEHSANLVYSYESGALNESFSDIFGVAIDFYKNPATANYLMGEAISLSNTPIRSIKNPNDYGDPDTYQGQNWVSGSSDNGGVHTNSGVQNFWFYLLCEGGADINDLGNSYAVNAIGLEKTAKIAYRNLTVYLTPTSDYEDARYYSIQSAIDLFGECSAEVIAVTNAWYAVGVGSPYDYSVISSYSVSTLNACNIPATIYFYNQSKKATNYLWNFGDGTTDTQSNPQHTYTTAGSYTISLVSTGTSFCNTSDTLTQVITINQGQSPLAISCIPQSLKTGDAGIFKFKLFNFSKTTNGSIDNYQDFTCSDSITIVEGKNYNVSFNVGNSVKENVSMWIDLNNDGIFNNSSELIIKKTNISKYFSDSVNIPYGAAYNTLLRLRIKTDINTYPITDACSNSNYGQTHDYSIIIKQNTSAPAANFAYNKKSIISGDSIIYTDKSVNLPTSWKWSFPGGIPSVSSLKNPVITYSTPGVYDVKFIATNSYGADSIVKVGFVKVTTPAPQILTASLKDIDNGIVDLKWVLSTDDDIVEDCEDSIDFRWKPVKGIWSLSNGTYNVSTESSAVSSAYLYNPFPEFEYQLKMRKNSGNNANIGAFFNGDPIKTDSNGDWMNSYFIMLTADGNWKLSKVKDGVWTSFINWAFSPDIIKGLGSWNTIKFVYSKGYFDIWINEKLQGTFYDTTFVSGAIGLKMYDPSIGQAEFDDIILRPLNVTYQFGNVLSNSKLFVESNDADHYNPHSNNNVLFDTKFAVPLYGYNYLKEGDDSLSNSFKHYKVYRDSTLLLCTLNSSFTDTLQQYGVFNYKVTAVYEKSESLPALANLNWAEPISGECCSKAENLANLKSPYSDSTNNYKPNFNFCSFGSAPDRIFYIDVPKGSILKIGLTSYNYSTQLAVRTKGSCPGDSSLFCETIPSKGIMKFVNNTGIAQRYYIIVGGYSTYYGNFTLKWEVDTPSIPQSDFTADKTFISINSLVKFSDLSSGVPTIWNWNFEGATPSISTFQDPSVVYNYPGIYDVTLIVSNSFGSDTIIKQKFITASNLTYCTSNLGGQDCPGDITEVSIKGTTLSNRNHDICNNVDGSAYAMYPSVDNTTAIVKGGSIYELSVTTSKSDIISAWIDFNQNGVFESSEWTQVTTSSMPNIPIKVDIIIPGIAIKGKTVMRIRSRAVGNINGAGDACSSFGSGNTEDYVLSIIHEPNVPKANFTAKQGVIRGESVVFTDQSLGLPTLWKWYFTGGTPSSSTCRNPEIVYNTEGVYDVKLVTSNILGTDSVIKESYIEVTSGLPGENCTNPINLALLTSPYSGTTVGYKSDFSFCNMSSPDRIFYIDVPAGGKLTIGQTRNNFNSIYSLRVGGSCPGASEITCSGYGTQSNTYYNTEKTTQRVYYIIAGYNSYSGDFTLAWQLSTCNIPVADFSSDYTSVVKGRNIYFTDLTSGLPTSWKWTFEGGSPITSTNQNPSVYYNQPGVYSVTLKASNALGSDTITKTGYITVTLPPKPVANFYANSTNINVGNSIEFNDYSTNNPTSLTWTFTGGTPATSNSSYPYVVYNTPGIYDVKLVATNGGGSDSIIKTGYITVTVPLKPVAKFYASSNNIYVGNSIRFSDASTNSPTSQTWTFTGGTPSTSVSSYEYVYYSTPGIYDVKLVVSNGGGSDSIIKTGYVTVITPPKPFASFSSDATTIELGDYVYFYDNSTNNPTSRKWIFTGGTPSISTSRYAYVYYNTPGIYDVKLVVSNAGGSDSIIKTGYITVTTPPKPVANFSSGATNIKPGDEVYFYDNSTNNPTSRKWIFTGGIPSISTSSYEYVYYNTPGIYDVKLVVSNAGGSDSIIKTGYITVNVPQKPVVSFSSNTRTILSGNYINFYDNSTNNPTFSKWTFDGGSPSVSIYSSPTVYYGRPGVYNVKLVVSNAGGSDSIVKMGYVTVEAISKPVANFYSNSTTLAAGNYIYFYDLSSNTADSWKWTFDGACPNKSANCSPSVQYSTPGTYNVTLTVSNAKGADSLKRVGYITVIPQPKPIANFSSNVTIDSTGSYIYFYDNSLNNPTSWKWIFEGGTPSISTSSSPMVKYTSNGQYTVKLIVSNVSGTDSIVKTGYITITNNRIIDLGGSGYCPGDISAVSIAGTTMNNTNHSNCSTSGCSTYGAYPSSGNTTANLKTGGVYALSVTTTNSDIISVWIDYNQNGDFESSEWKQVATMSTSNIPSTVNISIPVNAVEGNTTMRIRSRSYVFLNGANDACSQFGTGITEDYIVNIAHTKDFTVDSTSVCENGEVIFTNISAASVNSFLWNFGSGASPLTATTEGPHTVIYSTSGNKTVTLILNNNDSIVKRDYITVKPAPVKPIITIDDNSLYSDIAEGNQWYLVNFGALSEAILNSYKPTQSGRYYSIVSSLGCNSQQSNILYFQPDSAIKISPNPFSDIVNVKIGTYINVQSIDIIDATGKTVLISNGPYSNKEYFSFNMSSFGNGSYTILIKTNKEFYKYKVLKIK